MTFRASGVPVLWDRGDEFWDPPQRKGSRPESGPAWKKVTPNELIPAVWSRVGFGYNSFGTRLVGWTDGRVFPPE